MIELRKRHIHGEVGLWRLRSRRNKLTSCSRSNRPSRSVRSGASMSSSGRMCISSSRSLRVLPRQLRRSDWPMRGPTSATRRPPLAEFLSTPLSVWVCTLLRRVSDSHRIKTHSPRRRFCIASQMALWRRGALRLGRNWGRRSASKGQRHRHHRILVRK